MLDQLYWKYFFSEGALKSNFLGITQSGLLFYFDVDLGRQQELRDNHP